MDARGQCVISGTLMAEEAEACFVLPLREVVAHFARRKGDPRRQEMSSPDNDGDAPTNVG